MTWKVTTRIPYFNYTRKFATFDEMDCWLMSAVGHSAHPGHPCGIYKVPNGEFTVEEIVGVTPQVPERRRANGFGPCGGGR